MEEIIFVVKESEEGGYLASALTQSIFTEGESLDEIRANVKEAVLTHFDDGKSRIIRLHLVHDEVIEV
jgi:predicted RNase H-like HicB family nuclease